MGKAPPPAAKMPWGYLSSKNEIIQYKKFIYTINTTQCLYKVLSISISSICVVQFRWVINPQESFVSNNQTSLGLRRIERLILSSTKVICGVTIITEGVPFDSMLKFLLEPVLFNLVISLKRFKQKHNYCLICLLQN